MNKDEENTFPCQAQTQRCSQKKAPTWKSKIPVGLYSEETNQLMNDIFGENFSDIEQESFQNPSECPTPRHSSHYSYALFRTVCETLKNASEENKRLFIDIFGEDSFSSDMNTEKKTLTRSPSSLSSCREPASMVSSSDHVSDPTLPLLHPSVDYAPQAVSDLAPNNKYDNFSNPGERPKPSGDEADGNGGSSSGSVNSSSSTDDISI